MWPHEHSEQLPRAPQKRPIPMEEQEVKACLASLISAWRRARLRGDQLSSFVNSEGYTASE